MQTKRFSALLLAAVLVLALAALVPQSARATSWPTSGWSNSTTTGDQTSINQFNAFWDQYYRQYYNDLYGSGSSSGNYWPSNWGGSGNWINNNVPGTASLKGTGYLGFARVGNCNEWISARENADRKSTRLDKINLGETVQIVGWDYTGVWARVLYSNGTKSAWCDAAYLVR